MLHHTRISLSYLKTIQIVTKIFLLVATLTLYAIALRYTITPYQSANDFFIPWRAIQLLLQEGKDPYGQGVTRDIQQFLFGHQRATNEHQFDFAYPLTVLPLLAPYTFFVYEWAQSLWYATFHLLLISSTVLWIKSCPRLVSTPISWLGTILWVVTIYPATRAFMLGQLAVIVFAAIGFAIWSLEKERYGIAGTALALSTIKPQISFLFVPMFLMICCINGRLRVIQTFLLTFGGLVVFSLLALPTWPIRFLHRLTEYSRYTNTGTITDSPSVIKMIAQGMGFDSWGGEIGLMFVVGLLLWWGVWRFRATESWTYLASGILLVTMFIAPRTATTDQIVLLLPLLWLMNQLSSRKVVLIVAICVWGLLWLFFVSTLRGSQEALQVRVLLPLCTLLLWAWVHPLYPTLPSIRSQS